MFPYFPVLTLANKRTILISRPQDSVSVTNSESTLSGRNAPILPATHPNNAAVRLQNGAGTGLQARSSRPEVNQSPTALGDSSPMASKSRRHR